MPANETTSKHQQPLGTIEKNTENDSRSIEERALPTWPLRIALEEMREYRSWSENTYQSYVKDIDKFDDFGFQEGFDPFLGNISLHHVNKWIKYSKENGVAFATIKRRIASLSGLFNFYKGMGIVTSNPFIIVEIPAGATGEHSRTLELEEIIEVYEAAHYLREEEEKDVSVTLGVLFNTGLRGHALSHIKVRDVLLDKELIHYDAGLLNNKHKVQYFPIPPRLMEEIKQHIENNDLQPDDQLLYGLAGKPLQNKQINFITNRINKVLGWKGDQHVTPHGYRSSIATILDERGIDLDCIKYLLGHSITKDNIQYYLKRDQRKIRALRRELTKIENEIYEALNNRTSKQEEKDEAVEDSMELQDKNDSTTEQMDQESQKVSVDYFIQLTKTNPQLAQKLAEMNLVAM
ncbi:tyrosine-type recombinase/integrase [Rossellomorea vietnamensis]|uniref:tyrosine-type recombinase/integrase n=1 Tax=Rossellomorea vietnamensis TaxID=218284 RepID=UPI003CF50A01